MGLDVIVRCNCPEATADEEDGYITHNCPNHEYGWFFADRVGSYGWFNSFRTTVQDQLEDGEWGKRFPLLMDHSDCDGDYDPSYVPGLLHELAEIRKGLAAVTYPAAKVYDVDGNLVDEEYAYNLQGGGFFAFAGKPYVSFGIDEEGLVFSVKDGQTFSYKELVVPQAPQELKGFLEFHKGWHRLVFEPISALDTFTDVIETLEGACVASQATGNPIIFC